MPDGEKLEYFQTFFGDKIMNKIVEQTHLQHDYLMEPYTDSSDSEEEEMQDTADSGVCITLMFGNFLLSLPSSFLHHTQENI